jgi:hypothetical protein
MLAGAVLRLALNAADSGCCKQVSQMRATAPVVSSVAWNRVSVQGFVPLCVALAIGCLPVGLTGLRRRHTAKSCLRESI